MKQNEFIQSVIDILRHHGEKYNRYRVEDAMWTSLRSLNKSRGITSGTFTPQQEAFVRRAMTELVIKQDKVWDYDTNDVRACIINAMEVSE